MFQRAENGIKRERAGTVGASHTVWDRRSSVTSHSVFHLITQHHSHTTFLLLIISLRFLRSSTLKTKYKDIYRPSTGAVMLLAALHTCDKVETPPCSASVAARDLKRTLFWSH